MTTSDVTRAVRKQEDVAVVRGHVASEQIAGFLGGAFTEVMAAVAQQGRQITGMPFGRYRPAGDGSFDVEAGFPVDAPLTAQGRVEPGTLPGGPTASVVHRGAYDTVAAAYETVVRAVEESGGRVTGAPWECYLDEPGAAEPRTEVVVPYSETESAAGSSPTAW